MFHKNRFWRSRRFLPHRTVPRMLMLLWSGFFSLAIGYYVLDRLHVFASVPLPPSHLVSVNDDHVATIKWSPSPDSDAVGYKVTWGEIGGESRTAFTSYPDIQIEPLDENKTYQVKVQAVDKNGELSPAIGPVAVKSDSSYVKKLALQMNALFDDFNDNSYNGLPNPLHWYTTVTNASSLSMAYVSGVDKYLGIFAQNVAKGETSKQSSLTMRALTPFDFTNRTGTLAFDFDFGERPLISGIGNGGYQWTLTISPTLSDTVTSNTIYNGNKVLFPLDGFQVYMEGDTIAFRKIANGVVVNEWDSTYSRLHPIRDINVRKHSVLTLSKDTASLYIDGAQVLTASNIDLGFSKGWVYNQYLVDNLPGLHVPYAVSHFDNIGFDGPTNYIAPVIHTYTAGGYGASDRKTIDFFNNSATFTINIPDATTGEQSERLFIDTQMQGNVVPKITVNGLPAAWPDISGVTDGEDYTSRVIPLPVGTLHPGTNTIVVSAEDKNTFSVSMQNVHAEIEFPHGTNLTYTPYAVPFSGSSVETQIPSVAPVPLFGTNAPLHKSVVSGTIPVEVLADGNYSLFSTGHVNAVTQVELDVDGAPQAFFTLQNPTVKTNQVLQLDTTKIPNGPHTITLTAYGIDKNTNGTIASLNSADPLLASGGSDTDTLYRRIIIVSNGVSKPTAAPTVVLQQSKQPTATPTNSSISPTTTAPIPSNASESAVLGNASAGNVHDVNEANHITGSRFTTDDRGGKTESMSVFVGSIDASPNNSYQLAIYSDKGGRPGNLLATTSIGTLFANTWNMLPIAAVLTPHTTYWLVYNTNAVRDTNNAMVYSSSLDNDGISAFQPFGSFPQVLSGVSSGPWEYPLFVHFLPFALH